MNKWITKVRNLWDARLWSGIFDSAWYLDAYPDVAAAGVDPLLHFLRHGQAEGRLPCALKAVELDARLWAGARDAEADLRRLMHAARKNPLEASYAGWYLARWYAAAQRWPQALQAIRVCLGLPRFRPGLHTPDLLCLDALRLNGQTQAAQGFLQKQLDKDTHSDWVLAKANMQDAVDARLARLNDLYIGQSLAPLVLKADQPTAFDALSAVAEAGANASSSPLVSVLMPVYNAEKTLPTALQSLLAQSWRNLEIVLVDDASTDASYAVMQAWAEQDQRIKVLRLPSNQGAYAARNGALAQCTGDLITVHDSDDWSHPQKIALQVQALQDNPQAQASVSHWVRATESLELGGWQYPPNWASWCHRNTSSLMFRRSVFESLGFWDKVVCSADTEFYHRLLKTYGQAAVVEVRPQCPLAYGRITATSLTQASATSIFSAIAGLRCNYYQAFRAWHEQAAGPEDLYMPAEPEQRPFPVEAAMLRAEDQVKEPE